jgi:serine protease Do
VALLKVEATGLQAVTLGSSNALIVGDQVAAIGNPLGELTSTLTVGYISAKERDVNTEGFAINMLQTDAAINSGNSGGPLFNMKGEVIGITTAKYSGTSSSGASIEGVGFAIPIDDVIGMLSDLMNYGFITGAYLGVMVSDMDPTAANYYGLPVGAYVQEATEGYAAFKAGVMEKDIIVELGGIKVSTVNDLTRALRSFKAGDETTIVVYRSGREMTLNITLDAKPGQE